ncbi:MAG: hypothetical protein MK135_17245, partial [Polyangiaceae bacterium]|nr:hypothetical protein [Polyangiaceae bacterium]
LLEPRKLAAISQWSESYANELLSLFSSLERFFVDDGSSDEEEPSHSSRAPRAKVRQILEEMSILGQAAAQSKEESAQSLQSCASWIERTLPFGSKVEAIDTDVEELPFPPLQLINILARLLLRTYRQVLEERLPVHLDLKARYRERGAEKWLSLTLGPQGAYDPLTLAVTNLTEESAHELEMAEAYALVRQYSGRLLLHLERQSLTTITLEFPTR